MDQRYIEDLLRQVKEGRIGIEEATEQLRTLPYKDLGFAHIDEHRNLRTGLPEVVYCKGKTTAQITGILKTLKEHNANILATRASRDVFDQVKKEIPDAIYHEAARIIVVNAAPHDTVNGTIAVVTAGTADIPAAEEAAVTAEVFGNSVTRIYDVGVAGIHRLLAKVDIIREADVVIVIAGMEGALASVVGGLVDKPVVAVPTSTGYGASFEGIAPLLTMINSCSAGVAVVNIDNGFGAGYLASTITRQIQLAKGK